MAAGERNNPFAGLTLDRAAERRTQPEWLAGVWPQGKLVLVDFEGRAAFDPKHDALASLSAADVDSTRQPESAFLGLKDGSPWFALAAQPSDGERLSDRVRWVGLREAAASLSAFDAGMFAYAKALLLWQTRARFCGACGTATQRRRAGHSMRCMDSDCGLEHFPRTDAAIIVLVTDGPRALLGRQANWPARRYSTLAGFVEPGESLEDALRREVHEESGVRVGACRYQSSQPWPFPASLMVGFRAQAIDPSLSVGDELEDARWLSATELLDGIESKELLMPLPVSVSFRLIADWLLESGEAERARSLLAIS